MSREKAIRALAHVAAKARPGWVESDIEQELAKDHRDLPELMLAAALAVQPGSGCKWPAGIRTTAAAVPSNPALKPTPTPPRVNRCPRCNEPVWATDGTCPQCRRAVNGPEIYRGELARIKAEKESRNA